MDRDPNPPSFHRRVQRRPREGRGPAQGHTASPATRLGTSRMSWLLSLPTATPTHHVWPPWVSTHRHRTWRHQGRKCRVPVPGSPKRCLRGVTPASPPAACGALASPAPLWPSVPLPKSQEEHEHIPLGQRRNEEARAHPQPLGLSCSGLFSRQQGWSSAALTADRPGHPDLEPPQPAWQPGSKARSTSS